jgi:two-component system chemotaxis response regulator CheY
MTKVLVVDDAEVIRDQLTIILKDAGFTVMQAIDGLDGIEVAEKENDIDLLISDFNMPGMDGISMCKKIREIERYQDLTIFMLTTESSTDLKAKGKEAGVMAWITKPFKPEKLVNTINKVIQKKKT